MLKQSLTQTIWAMWGVVLSSVAWAQNTATEPPAKTLRVTAYQERLSSFIDGALIGDERAWVHHPSAPPQAAARTGLNIDWLAADPFGWSLGGFVESVAWIDGADGSVAALGIANNRRASQKDASYPFAVETQKYRRWGVKIGKQHSGSPIDQMSQIWWRAKGFVVDEYRWSRADGNLSETLTGELGLQAQIEQQGLGGHSLFVNPQKALGYGVGLDLGLQWRTSPAMQWQVSLEDIGPRIDLPHVLSNSTQYNTHNVSYDANGYIQYVPMTSGQYRDVSALLRIEPRLNFSGRWDVRSGLAWIGGISHQMPFTQVHLGLQNSFVDGLQLQTIGYVGTGDLPASLGLIWTNRNLSLGWRGNVLSPAKARIWSFSAQLAY